MSIVYVNYFLFFLYYYRISLFIKLFKLYIFLHNIKKTPQHTLHVPEELKDYWLLVTFLYLVLINQNVVKR